MNRTKTKIKSPTTKELGQQIAHLFENPDAEIESIKVSSERQLNKEIQAILNSTSTKSWDDKFDGIMRLMSLVKGAYLFKSFITSIDSFCPLISECILNFRSTLVKYSCLLVAQLSKVLGESFKSAVYLIPILFQPTTNGTQVIAESCKQAIFSIAKYCKNPKILRTILDKSKSKSSVHRTIVANCIFIVISNSSDEQIQIVFKYIKRPLIQLLSDASQEARSISRSTIDLLYDKHPSQLSKIFGGTQTTVNGSFSNQTRTFSFSKVPRRSASVDNKRVNQTSNFQSSPKKEQFLENTEILLKNGEIESNSTEIVEAIIDAITSKSPSVLNRGLSVLNKAIQLIPDAFKESLSTIIQVLLREDNFGMIKTKKLSSKILNFIINNYDTNEIIKIALSIPNSISLITFIQQIINHSIEVLNNRRIMNKVLSNCCFICKKFPKDRQNALELIMLICDSYPNEFNEFINSSNEELKNDLIEMGVIKENSSKIFASSDVESIPESDKSDAEYSVNENNEKNVSENSKNKMNSKFEFNDKTNEEEENEDEQIINNKTNEKIISNQKEEQIIDNKPKEKINYINANDYQEEEEEIIDEKPNEKIYNQKSQINENKNKQIEKITYNKREEQIAENKNNQNERIIYNQKDEQIINNKNKPKDKNIYQQTENEVKDNKNKTNINYNNNKAPKEKFFNNSNTSNKEKFFNNKSDISNQTTKDKFFTNTINPKSENFFPNNKYSQREEEHSSDEAPTKRNNSSTKPNSHYDKDTEELMNALINNKDRTDAIRNICKYLEENSCKDIDIILPNLILLTKTKYANEVEKCFDVIGKSLSSHQLFDIVIPLCKRKKPLPFVDFLIRIIAASSKCELEPNIKKILPIVSKYLTNELPALRRSATMIYVEIYKLIGDDFISEISKLKNVQRKIILHFYQNSKKSVQSR